MKEEIDEYLDALEWIESNGSDLFETAQNISENKLSGIMDILYETLAAAMVILYKDGKYQKPTFLNFRLIALGKIALTMIFSIVKLLKPIK